MEIILTKTDKRKRFRAELVDMLRGAAMQFIFMCVISATFIILSNTEEFALKLVAVIVGELFLIAACIIFGRGNGKYAYRHTIIGEKKRNIDSVTDHAAYYKTGEYAPWKGFVISAITTIPFLIFQIVYCFLLDKMSFVYFVLQYAFSWGVAPLDVIGNVPQPVYLLMALLPIAVHGLAYIWGAKEEKKKHLAEERASEIKNQSHKAKGKK